MLASKVLNKLSNAKYCCQDFFWKKLISISCNWYVTLNDYFSKKMMSLKVHHSSFIIYSLKKMAIKKDETPSFMLRFTQKIFKNKEGESQVQWRGNIRHVQGGDEKRFSEFDDAVNFIQGKLAEMTIQQMEDKSPEEQKGILSKSFTLWKKMALSGPKMVMETIKDPKKQVEQIQSQIQDQVEAIQHKVETRIAQNVDVDEWRGVSKSDHKSMMDLLAKMSKEISTLNKRVNKISKKEK